MHHVMLAVMKRD